MTVFFVVCGALFLAYSNGANDNFKGVATLYGSDTLGHRAALILATITTFLGSLTALFFGAALVASFSGKGLVPDSVVGDPAFLGAVGVGAAGTVLLATRVGFPISTTHALVGALLGAGLVEAGAAVSFEQLGKTFVAPLLFSPAIAAALASAEYPALSQLRQRLGITRQTCVCAGDELIPISAGSGLATAMRSATVTLGTTTTCTERYGGDVAGVSAQQLLNGVHYVSAAAVSFARGMNDTPKIVALLLTAKLLAPEHGLLLIGLAMAAGGLIAGRRVAETMSRRITVMNPGQALTGNLTTAGLVLLASRFGLPVSTTHVSCGALFGIGLVSGRARWRTIVQIALAWLITVPVAAAVGATVMLVLRA
jgi:inorganic phosphate transporter, PiT family